MDIIENFANNLFRNLLKIQTNKLNNHNFNFKYNQINSVLIYLKDYSLYMIFGNYKY